MGHPRWVMRVMGLLRQRSRDTVRALRLLTLGALLVPVFIFAAAAWKDRSAILENAEKDGVKIVALFREQTDNLFSGHEIILDLAVERARGRDWEAIQSAPDLLRELEVIDRRLDGASEILLVDATGIVRATTVHKQPSEPPPAFDRRCFVSLSKNELQSCVGMPQPDASSEHNLFSLSQRLERDGAFDGIAQVAISADYLVGLWASSMPSAADIVTMYRSDGMILAQSGSQSPIGPRLPDLGKTLIDKIGKNDSGIIRTPLFADGADLITIYTKVAARPVYIGLSLNKDAVLGLWYANLAVYGLVAASAAVAIAVAFGAALRRAQSERLAVDRWQSEVEERLKTQEQLHQSQKMEGLGKLTGGISHDFNNLLTVITGNIDLARRAALDSRTEKFLQNASKAGESAVILTQRLLSFARQQVLQPRSVDLSHLVEGLDHLLLRTLGPDVRLKISGTPGLWPALVDPNQIEMIILNLAINARDAMPKGGTLSITVSNKEFGPDAPRELAPGQYVVLAVCDTGTGMDAAVLARATEPFFSTKEVGKGTGLGLSMMQSVVTQSGGTSRLRSQPGCGTQIELWLPRAPTPPEETEISKVQDVQQDSGVILVCDDDPAVLEFVCDVLDAKGYQSLPATGGRLAISKLNQNDLICLLVVDLTMPEMNGPGVIHEVRATHPQLPILLMTGNADPESIQADLPEIPILRKPFSQEQLTSRVAEVLGTGRKPHVSQRPEIAYLMTGA